ILASGLDSRAYRLAWPAQTVVYEIDQPQVMEFKTRTLAELGATPTADRRVVTADLRADWPTALGAAGFDPTQPTAWSAEGLLRYLPPEAQDRLLDNVTALSVPDSRFATESIRNFKPHHEERMRERMTILANRWRAYGFDLDMNELVYFGDRNEPASYLSDNGWLLTEIKSQDLLTANGFQPFEDEEVPLPDFFYVSARLQRKHRQYPAHRKPAPSWRHTACPVNELSKSAAYTMTRSDAHQASTTAPPPPGLTG
ncbi:SAM-dependent methyltransferase, partial [Mycobacterium tuberculosis]